MTGAETVETEERPTGQRRAPLVPVLLGLIMLGGLLVRLIFFTASAPFNGAPLVWDEGNYLGIAESLYRGIGFAERTVWLRPPGYPGLLALFLWIANGSRTLALLGQVALSVANIGAVYGLTREVFAQRVDVAEGKAKAAALVSAGLMAINPQAASYSNLFMVETLYMLLISLLFWAVLRALRAWKALERARPSRNGLLLLALAGLFAAGAALTRSQLLSFVPLLMGWFWWVLSRSGAGSAGRRAAARHALLPVAIFLVVVLVSIIPWTVRNYVRYHRFLLIETTGGYNLWLYNDVIGRDEINSRLLAIPNPVDRESYATQQALIAIAKDPGTFAQSAAQRFIDSWSVEQYSELHFAVRDKYPGTDCTVLDLYAWGETLFYVGFGLLTLWGFVIAPGRTFKGLFLLVLLHYAIVNMLTFTLFRFRLPLYPLAGVYAAWAIVSLAGRIRQGKERDATNSTTAGQSRTKQYLLLGGAGLLSCLFLVQCSMAALPGLIDSIRYERRYLAGKEMMDTGDYASALANFAGAAQIDHSCACLYRNIGLAYAALGQHDEEREAYKTAILREANDWRARALLSDRLRAAGDPGAAKPVNSTPADFRAEQQRWAWQNLSPPAVSQLDVGTADIGYIMGFETAESETLPGGGTISYRWTTSRSSIRLTPPSDGKLSLVIRWHSLAWPGKLNMNTDVRILLDGRDIGTVTARPGWETTQLEVAAIGKKAPVVIELHAPIDRPPGLESRYLGVAIDSLGLEAAK